MTTRYCENIICKGTASGKLLLFGEHSAVYGKAAVGLPIPCSTTVDIKLNKCNTGSIEYSGMNTQEQQLFWEILKTVFSEVFPSRPLPEAQEYSGEVIYTSTVPQSGGYGSSAAVCGAIAAALANLYGLNKEEIPRLTNKGEKIFHGTPSGIDAVLCTSMQLTAIYPPIEKTEKVENIKDPFPAYSALHGSGFYLVSASIPREKTTKELVAGISEMRTGQAVKIDKIIDDLGTCAKDAIDILKAPVDTEQVYKLGKLVDRAHTLLSKLDLSTPELEMLLEQGRKNGALGGKLSGAGGGGAFYLVCSDIETAQEVHSLITSLIKNKLSINGSILPVIEIGENVIYERN